MAIWALETTIEAVLERTSSAVDSAETMEEALGGESAIGEGCKLGTGLRSVGVGGGACDLAFGSELIGSVFWKIETSEFRT